MKGLSRKKFSPCRQQFLAASQSRTGNHFKLSHDALAPGRSTYLEATPANPSFPLSTVFVFAFGLAVCLVVYVVTCKDVPTMVLFATPVCRLGL